VLSGKRMREHAALFAALLGVVALVSGLSVGLIGFLGQSADDGVRSGLASRAGADLALRASISLDPVDAAGQDAEVRAAIASSMGGLTVTVDRIVSGRVKSSVTVDGVLQPQHRAGVFSIPDLPERATLVDGAWPETPEEISVQADGAARLGVGPGDTVRLGDADLTITGTWRATNHLDPRWLGDELLLGGADKVDYGPFVVDETVWPRLDSDPRGRWTIIPDSATLTAADLTAITESWNRIGTEWRGQVNYELISLEKQGRFKRTALELLTRVDGLRAIQPVVLLLLTAIALVTLAELGRLLTTTRSTEIALLWSRGASALDIGRSTAVEAGIAAIAGAALGTGVALAVLAGLMTPEAVGTIGPAVWIVPTAVTLAAVLVVAGSAVRSARRQTVRDPGDGAGRARRLAGPGVVVLAAAAAALSVWQLRLYGSPLTPTSDGGTDVDPVAVLAPALTLVAVVLLALVLFPRVASLDELATRHARVPRILAARTVARRLQLVAAPIVVVAVASSTLVVASAYAATWSDSFQRTSELRTGGPLHAYTGFQGLDVDAITGLRSRPGVDGVAPVELQNLQVGSDYGSIVAATPAAIARVATPASGTFDRTAVAAALKTDVPGPTLPDGASALTLTTLQTGFAAAPAVGAQISDGYGVLWQVDLGPASDAGPTTDPGFVEQGFHEVSYSAEFSPGLRGAPQPLQVLALDIAVSAGSVAPDGAGHFMLHGLTSGVTPLEFDPYWLPESPSFQYLMPPLSNFNGRGMTVDADARLVRLTPTFDDQMSDRGDPPVVVSQRLADDFDLGVGDTLAFTLEDAYDRTNATIAMIVPAIPGAEFETAAMVDLGLVLHNRVRVQDVPESPRDFWIDTADPESVAAALRPDLPANTRLTTSGDPAGRIVLGSAANALWLGALGCLVLAIIAVVAVVRAQLRSRRVDVVVLRAIGLGSRDQAAIRRRELGLVLGYGGVAGLLAGLVVSTLTVPQLARAAVIEPYSTVPTPLGFDLAGLGAGAAALALALLVIVGVYTARVVQQARTAIGAEEVT